MDDTPHFMYVLMGKKYYKQEKKPQNQYILRNVIVIMNTEHMRRRLP